MDATRGSLPLRREDNAVRRSCLLTDLFKDMLLEHLRVLERFRGVKVWTDAAIAPGATWREELDQAMATTDARRIEPGNALAIHLPCQQIAAALGNATIQNAIVTDKIGRTFTSPEHDMTEVLNPPLPRRR